MPETAAKSWQRKAQQMVQQDPRKAGVLGALLIVLALMVARHFLSGATAPVGAHAAHSGLREVDPKAAATKSASTPKSSSPVIAWLGQPAAVMDRNLFAIKLELFPPEVTKSLADDSVHGFWDEIAKSLTDQVDLQDKKQEMLQDLQAKASMLQVTSIMMGPAPRAVINDMLVGEGEVVAEFRVLKIEARRIIVEREGIRLEIQMK